MASNALGYIKHDDMFDNASVEDLVIDRATIANGAVKVSTVVVAEIPALVNVGTGTVGVHNCVVPGTTTVATLPAGYSVLRSEIRVVTALTGGAGSTLAIGTTSAAGAFETTEAVATFTPASVALLLSKQITQYDITAAENITYTVGTDPMTAGRIFVYLHLVATA